MFSYLSISWSDALRDLKADRAVRREVREERLRSGPHVHLSAWRGRSGRRYVVVIEPVTAAGLGDTVVIAVARDAAGIATLLAIGTVPAGATELHVHRLAETPADCAGVTEDHWA